MLALTYPCSTLGRRSAFVNDRSATPSRARSPRCRSALIGSFRSFPPNASGTERGSGAARKGSIAAGVMRAEGDERRSPVGARSQLAHELEPRCGRRTLMVMSRHELRGW